MKLIGNKITKEFFINITLKCYIIVNEIMFPNILNIYPPYTHTIFISI